MSTTKDQPVGASAGAGAGATDVDAKLEAVVIPVADVDRAKDFYGGLGWRLDADIAAGDAFRVVQYTPPGSPCSVQFGVGLTTAAPGTAENMYLVVSDVEAAREQFIARGANVSEAFHPGEPGAQFRADATGRVSGRDPGGTYVNFATFSDPDGNRWLFQEVTNRLPGRIDTGITSYGSAIELANALRRAEAAHVEHEKRTGEHDEDWASWFAAYMAAEESGAELPT